MIPLVLLLAGLAWGGRPATLTVAVTGEAAPVPPGTVVLLQGAWRPRPVAPATGRLDLRTLHPRQGEARPLERRERVEGWVIGPGLQGRRFETRLRGRSTTVEVSMVPLEVDLSDLDLPDANGAVASSVREVLQAGVTALAAGDLQQAAARAGAAEVQAMRLSGPPFVDARLAVLALKAGVAFEGWSRVAAADGASAGRSEQARQAAHDAATAWQDYAEAAGRSAALAERLCRATSVRPDRCGE